MNPKLEHFYHHQTLPSTMDATRELARQAAPEWSIVFAESQTAGRGRQGKLWQSAPGSGLYFTVLLYPNLKPEQLGLLPLLVGASLGQTITRRFAVPTKLKWSNDILSPDNRKLCGILLEQSGGSVLLGIGLNVRRQAFPAEFMAASLEDYTSAIDRQTLLEQLIGDLKRVYNTFLSQPNTALSLWKALPNFLGETIQVLEPNGAIWQGVALDLEPTGGLLVRHPFGTTTVYSAQVSLLRS